LLRESSRAKKEDYDLTLLTGTEGDGNIPHGALLVAFTDAVVKYEDGEAARLRAEIRAQMGDDALVDASAIVAAFSGFDRLADSTGIPLEDAKAENSADFRAALGINAFAEKRGEIADPRDRPDFKA
jgi:alcohol dehydrogenase class IV